MRRATKLSSHCDKHISLTARSQINKIFLTIAEREIFLKRIAWIDTVRVFAAFMIIVTHYFMCDGFSMETRFGVRLYEFASMSVVLFFCYGTYQSYVRPVCGIFISAISKYSSSLYCDVVGIRYCAYGCTFIQSANRIAFAAGRCHLRGRISIFFSVYVPDRFKRYKFFRHKDKRLCRRIVHGRDYLALFNQPISLHVC